MPEKSEIKYTIAEGKAEAKGVELNETEKGKLEVKINGEMFTSYNFGEDVPRPFLYPVIGPYGDGVTRNFPMKQVEGEKTDHKHHRSIYVAYGEVNGTDNWSEDGNYARQIHKKFDEIVSGPVFGRFAATNDWVSHEGEKQVEEQRVITFYNLPSSERVVDVEVTFKATEKDVHFGDTKEGGILAVRVATSMDGDRGGMIVNAIGAMTESECWGKPAHWVDYVGPVEGKTVGITIMDHPDSFRYPTRWHVRDYGLFTANPFAMQYYEPEKGVKGDYTIKKGDLLRFKYRLYIHAGDTQQGEVKDRYFGFIFPPKVYRKEVA
jgi:hypothetical protein